MHGGSRLLGDIPNSRSRLADTSLGWTLLWRCPSPDPKIGQWIQGLFPKDWMWLSTMYGERPTKACGFSGRDHFPRTGSWAVGILNAGTSHVIAWLSLRWSLGHACFSLFGPPPCPCRALENRLEGRRMSINYSNSGECADAMCDLRTVGRLRHALHGHVGYPSIKEPGE